MTASPHSADRRHEPRIDMVRPCKIFDPRSGKYIAGSTANLSDRGALLDIHRRMNLTPGDRLFIGVAFKRREAVLQQDEMLQATVVRAMGTPNQHTVLALRFDEPMAISADGHRSYLEAA